MLYRDRNAITTEELYVGEEKSANKGRVYFLTRPPHQGSPPASLCEKQVGSCSWKNKGGFAGVLQVGRGFTKAPPEQGLSISEQWHKWN